MIRILRTAIITAVIGGAVSATILWSNWVPEAPMDDGPAAMRAKQFAHPNLVAQAEQAKQREKQRLQQESDRIKHKVADLLAAVGESELSFSHYKKLLECKLAGRDTITGRELRIASEAPDGNRDPLAKIKASSSGNSEELIAMLSGFR